MIDCYRFVCLFGFGYTGWCWLVMAGYYWFVWMFGCVFMRLLMLLLDVVDGLVVGWVGLLVGWVVWVILCLLLRFEVGGWMILLADFCWWILFCLFCILIACVCFVMNV